MTEKRPTEAFHSENLFETGMGYVVVSRFKTNGLVEAGVFLLDVYCLGAKNAFFSRLSIEEYETQLLDSAFAKSPRVKIEPCCARKLVEDAVAYAQRLGFAPHADYKAGCRVFGGIETNGCKRTFPFGCKGKPLFISGPNDSEEKSHRILSILKRSCGEGNFDYIVESGNRYEDS